MTGSLIDWRTTKDDKEKYKAYLCSPEWGRLRAAVTERSGGVCEVCTVLEQDAVHHLTYARKYKERLEDLQAICDSCHKFAHGKSEWDPRLYRRYLAWLKGCKNRGEIPIPFELAADILDASALRDDLCELLRAARMLCVADMEGGAVAVVSSLPFSVPRWWLHHGWFPCGPGGLAHCYRLFGFRGVPNEWWKPDDEEDSDAEA